LCRTQSGEESTVKQLDKLVETCLGYTISYGATALVASNLLHSLAKKADKNNETALRDSLNSYAREFEKRAIGVLNQCYKDNKLDSEELVKMKVDECGNKSILMIADVGYMEFM
ncbi:hypothetical protein LSAT2_009699, partial [Lamellibrachia satsuma]